MRLLRWTLILAFVPLFLGIAPTQGAFYMGVSSSLSLGCSKARGRAVARDIGALQKLVSILRRQWGDDAADFGAHPSYFLDDPSSDFTPFFYRNEQDFFVQSEPGDSAFADCGFGIEGDPSSLERAARKIENALQWYRGHVERLFPESLGFRISESPRVRIEGEPGSARVIILDRDMTLEYAGAPGFSAKLISWDGPYRAVDQFFETLLTIRYVLEDFVRGGPAAIESAFARALAAQAQALDASWAPRFSMDFTVGAERSFVPMQRRYGPYLAAEMSYRLECGSRKAGAQLSVWKMRTRHSFVITGMAGVAARNRWAIYCPCSFVLTSARLSLQEASTEGCRDAGEHISKKQTGWESGLGVRLFVSKHFTFGLRGTLGTYSKIQLQRQGYTLALGDGKRRVVYRVGVEFLIPLG